MFGAIDTPHRILGRWLDPGSPSPYLSSREVGRLSSLDGSAGRLGGKMPVRVGRRTSGPIVLAGLSIYGAGED